MAIVPLLYQPIADEARRAEIVARLKQEKVAFSVTDAGIFYVTDKGIAQQLRALFAEEGVISVPEYYPRGYYNIWDEELNVTDWSDNAFEKEKRAREAEQRRLKESIERFSYIESAALAIIPKKDSLYFRYSNTKEPTQVKIILTLHGETPSAQNCQSLQDLVLNAVPALHEETPSAQNCQFLQDLVLYAVPEATAESVEIYTTTGIRLNDPTHLNASTK